uniref:Uncharacterized protein n=1 Tax=Meloidogyne incognita TaxID=6306 RepID=A0A914N0L6_MELIC
MIGGELFSNSDEEELDLEINQENHHRYRHYKKKMQRAWFSHIYFIQRQITHNKNSQNLARMITSQTC